MNGSSPISQEPDGALAGFDAADLDGAVTVRAQDVDGAELIAGRHGHDHPDTQVEDARHLAVGDFAGVLDLGEDARHLPGAAVDHRVTTGRQHAVEVAGYPATGDMRDGADIDAAP